MAAAKIFKYPISAEVTLTITYIGPNAVKVGIDAPRHISVVREEADDGRSDMEREAGGE